MSTKKDEQVKVVNSFDIMKRMSAENMDIMMFPDLVEVKSVKAGGHLKFGVPKEAIYKMLPDPDRYMLFVLAMDRNQYRGVQESMQQEEAAMPMSKVRELAPYIQHMPLCRMSEMYSVKKPCSCGLDTLKEELRTMGVDL